MTEPTLEFLRNEAGEKEGLGDAGIETFRDAPYASCAREAGQNSRDAEETLPVRMTFNVIDLSHGEFPAYDQLLRTLEACSAAAEQEKEEEFFSNALDVAMRPEIPVLEMADYNTKGLTGPPDEPGTPFHSLLKSTGVSTKESETAGGSFGIGKNASFAVSDLQMVLYSTRYAGPEGDTESFAAQGKIKLVSHSDSTGVRRRATGYWGDASGFAAITERDQIPLWMQRNHRGTSIFCMGFRESDDWAEHMTSSLVTNFFCAAHREEMVFEVSSGKFQINKNTLEGLLADGAIRDAAEKSGDLPELEFAGQLYRCLVSPNAEERTIAIPGLGAVRVRVLTEPGMPRRIGFIRNGMLITDNLHHFGQPLMRFPGSRDFIALVEPADSEAGKLLKRLENPAHDNFSAQRIADPVKRKTAEMAMRRLGKKLRDMIKETTGIEHQDSVILEELGKFFAEAGRAPVPPDPKAEHDPETHTFEPPRVRPRRSSAPGGLGQDGGRPGTGSGSGGKGGGSGPVPGAGTGGRGRKGTRDAIELRDLRNTIGVDESGTPLTRMLHFTPTVGGRIQLTLQATGVNNPESLRVTGASAGTVADDGLALTVTAGERYHVMATFAVPYGGPLEVTAVSVDSTEESE